MNDAEVENLLKAHGFGYWRKIEHLLWIARTPNDTEYVYVRVTDKNLLIYKHVETLC